MPITRIPEGNRRGLARIHSISHEGVHQLCAALSKCPATADLDGLSSRVGTELKNWKREDVEVVLRAVFSLSIYRIESSVTAEKIAEEITSVLRTTSAEDLRLAEGEEEGFKDKLSKLLSLKVVDVSARAASVRGDYLKTFSDAKILTDIRPVFAETIGDPIGAVISHTLKIEYHEDGHKRFYVVLDAEDLRKLKTALKKAESKAAALKSTLAKSGVADLDLS